MLDVNAGIPLADEPAILAQAVQLVQGVTDVPLSIDSSIVAALESGLAVYQGKALVNSVTGEEDRLESVLPLVAKHGAAVVAITNDESGISEDPDVRFEVARRIVSRAGDHGIPIEDVVVDPLVMPIGAIGTAGRQVFRIVRRLREELGVNTTCGASNVSFGLPNRPALNAAFLPMAIASGLTSAITSPLHAEMLQAVKAADVLMGNDAHCANWIALQRRLSRRRGPHVAAAAAARAGDGRRHHERRPTHSSSSPRPAGEDGSSTGRPCSRPRGGSVSTSTRSAAAAASAAAARSRWSEGEHAKHGMTSAAHAPDAGGRGRSARTQPTAGSRRDAGSAAPPASSATSSSTFRPRASSTARSSARRPTRMPIEIDPVVRLYYVEVARRRARHRRPATSGACARRSPSEWDLDGLDADPTVLPELQRRSRRRRRRGHGRRPRRLDDHGCLARPPRPRVRHRVRRRLDHRRRPPLRPAHGRGARLGRRDEPADPLRRGSDEPRLVRHAAPRLGEGADEGRPWLPREADGGARDDGRDRPSRRPRGHGRREPDHAPPPARDRPDAARRRSVPADGGRGRSPARPRARPPGAPWRARLRAAVHRRPRRRRRGRRDPLGGPVPGRRGEPHRRRRHQRGDRARQPRPTARGVEPDRSRVRRRADLLRAACCPGRDRARPHRPADARAARARHRVRGVVGRAGVRGRAGHRRLRLGDHRGDRRAPSRRRAHDRRHDRRRARRTARSGSSPTAARSPTSSGPASRSSSSRRTTSARSSSPRPRCTPAARS